MKKVALAAALLLGARSVAAQGIPPEPSAFNPAAEGFALGTAGFFGGVWIGAEINRNCTGEFCELGGAAIGGMVGETLGLAIGAHLGNRHRGNIGLDLLTSAGVAAGGIAIAVGNDNNAGGILLVTAVVQLAATVVVERGVGRAGERRVTASVMPMGAGRVGIGGSVALR